MTSPSKQIWAYLHRELSDTEKSQFEQALQEDSDLRQAYEEQMSTHAALGELLTPSVEEILSEEELTEKLIAEWAAEHPEQLEDRTPKTRRKILPFALPLAAAAALVILFALPSGPIRWQSTVYGSAPRLRGDSAEQSRYTKAQFKQAVGELQKTVESSCDASKKWTLRIYLQELADGALGIEVTGHSHHNTGLSKVWEKSFQSLENFREEVPRFGKQIANEL
ncbi:anti-sigma factor family protein [Tichowtungia aerotolerans]|uniref:Uncharacterized protein n=1 Tax=Tichowtungia aerotolerans TaxID=2697043 RepID=A0A6P1MAE3_9BACT|nr:hypothetical protein [Tichowtungia aerotolerans]QHI69068.1 hypothetical protein GT409_06285 [Tichowtungia aerotolerans]